MKQLIERLWQACMRFLNVYRMSCGFLSFLVLFVAVSACHADSLTNSSGKVYNDVTVIETSPTHLTFTYTVDGEPFTASLKLEDFPKDVQEKYNYNQEKATQFRAEEDRLDAKTLADTAKARSNSTDVTELDYTGKKLTSLDVSGHLGLTSLACNDNALTKLDVSRNAQLSFLWCADNALTNLNVSQNLELIKLDCSRNPLKILDVSRNVELTMLACSDDRLSVLDVFRNVKLNELRCSDNRLKNLDLSQNTELTYLNCASNQMTTLDLSLNPKLVYVDARGCNLTKITVWWYSTPKIPDDATLLYDGNPVLINPPNKPVPYVK